MEKIKAIWDALVAIIKAVVAFRRSAAPSGPVEEKPVVAVPQLDRAAAALLKVYETFGDATVSGSAFVIGAKAILANGGLSEAWAAYEGGDYSHLVDVGIMEGAEIIAAVDPRLRIIAPVVAQLVIFARHHPAGVDSPAMKAADGHGGGDFGTDHVVGP